MIPRLIRPAAAVLLVVLIGGVIPAAAAAQEVGGEAAGDASEVEVRIVARRLGDGRVEFGLQQRGSDASWGDRLLPSRRFFPADAGVGRWLSSSRLVLSVDASAFEDPSVEVDVRIVARRLASGRVEFGLQQRGGDGEWGERLLPTRRFFPPGATVDRWLASSPLQVTVPRPDLGTSARDGGRRGDPLIAVSHGRTCAVRLDGGVACWGRGALRDRFSVAGLDDVVAISIGNSVGAGQRHTCVLHEDGTVSCWGAGYDGALGQGETISHYLPVKVRGIRDAVAIAAGDYHACAVHADGGASCWGSNIARQLGEDTGMEPRALPERVPGVEDVATIAAGRLSNCAIHTDGTVSCWGWGPAYRFTESQLAREVPGLTGVTSIAIGRSDICAVRSSGRVYCLGNVRGTRPAPVHGVADVSAVTMGHDSICALHNDGGVSCWGARNAWGQLGNGTTRPVPNPARVQGVSDAVAVATSMASEHGVGAHTCVLHADGSATCWGANEFGQLGDGTTEARIEPTCARPVEVIPPEDVPETPTLLMRAWLDAAVAEVEADHPWLRVAWDYIRPDAAVDQYGVFGAAVDHRCRVTVHSRTCRAVGLRMHALEFEGLVHELTHVYDSTTGLAPARAWGAVQLYFASTYPDCFAESGQSPGAEILADTVAHLLVPRAWLGYYRAGCTGLPDRPSPEALEIVQAGLAGKVPDWYTENVNNGAELWTLIRRGPSLLAIINLADEFGGLCSTSWISYPLDPARLPPAGSNPFRDGGC